MTHIIRRVTLIGIALAVTGCAPRVPVQSQGGPPEPEIVQELVASPTATQEQEIEPVVTLNVPDDQQCQEFFENRELREPYQRYDDAIRTTLSTEELASYLALMGIESLCIPMEFGAPFINVDWGGGEFPPATGRMVSLGFEELYEGGGWSRGYLLYSTYDFSIGSEYDVFASEEDRDRVEAGTAANPIVVDGVKGFIRYHPGIAMGKQIVSKTYIFPFETYYLAVVMPLEAFEPSEVEGAILEMEAGAHPVLLDVNAALLDGMVASIQFR